MSKQTPIWRVEQRVWFRVCSDDESFDAKRDVAYGLTPPPEGEWRGQTELWAYASKDGKEYGRMLMVGDETQEQAAVDFLTLAWQDLERSLREALGEVYV